MSDPQSPDDEPSPSRTFPTWFYIVNTLALVIGAVILGVFLLGATLVDQPPYDYQYVELGTEFFCNDPANFTYNDDWLYPAPLYTALCLPVRYVPDVTLWLWMVIPFLGVVGLAGRRAAVLGYPPLVQMLRLGQSTWLVLPLYSLADRDDERPVRWWMGLTFGLSVFKPHIAILPVLWLAYRWRRQIPVLLTGLAAMVLVALPAFLMRPAWLFEWVGNGRGYRPVSIANLGIIPIQLLGLDLENTGGIIDQMIVWGFCAVVALVLYGVLRWRHGALGFYDWTLVFCLANPLIHDYDLIVLLPLIANRPRRLLLALVSGLVVWMYAGMSGYAANNTGDFNASVLIPVVLLAGRLLRTDGVLARPGPVIKW